MILPDRSAWIEYDRQTGSPVDDRMISLIRAQRSLAVTEPVLMEVVAGARSENRATDLRRLLVRFQFLALDTSSDFDAAALIFRRCRRAGVTPRGLLGCLIAAVAWRNGAVLLSHDKDMVRIARVMDIDLDPASR